MIRGINRQIVEVKETGDIYYGSACLVVKPEYASAEHELFECEARKILRNMDAPSGMKRARGTSFWVTWVVSSAAVATAAAILYFATT